MFYIISRQHNTLGEPQHGAAPSHTPEERRSAFTSEIGNAQLRRKRRKKCTTQKSATSATSATASAAIAAISGADIPVCQRGENRQNRQLPRLTAPPLRTRLPSALQAENCPHHPLALRAQSQKSAISATLATPINTQLRRKRRKISPHLPSFPATSRHSPQRKSAISATATCGEK
ncbi:MAG: hypothetical protein OJF49_002169 [Ktedonobacterales bacterium]|nr:MAG: hypothetical protein OJF49_002169 [Ktedonobacterales bacterium]